MKSAIRRFYNDKKGNFATITSIAMIPIMAGVVGVIDLTNQQNQENSVHNALDAAGIAIATKVGSGMTDSELTSLGEAVFEANIDNLMRFEADFDYPGTDRPVDPVTGKPNGDTFITVTATLAYKSLFSWGTDREVEKLTEVTVAASDPACVLALSEWESESVYIKGNAHLNLDGCNVASNSSSGSSIKRQGDAEITAGCIQTSGGTEGIPDTRVTTDCSEAKTGASDTKNPLADYSAPTPGACVNINNYIAGKSQGITTYNLVAGKTYCNNLSGVINLTTGGTYIFDNADINLLNSSHSLTGTGVTLVFLNGAALNGNGGTTNLTAPTDETDPYAGIVIYSGEGNTETFEFGGNAIVDLTGFVYMPDGNFKLGGTSAAGTKQCMRILANKVELSGNTEMKSDCETELAGLDIVGSNIIRIKR